MTELAYFLTSMGLGRAGTFAFRHLRPSSALALYAKRRERLQSTLEGKAQAQLPAQANIETGHGDPEDMSLDQTMRWLGLAPSGTREK